VTARRGGPVIPRREEFRALAAAGREVPVYRDVFADHETPVSAFRKLDDGAHAFLLESLEGGENWGRFSVVGSRPEMVFSARGERCEILQDGVVRPCAGPPPDELRALLAERQAVALPGLPRFCGGAVGYLGRGAARWFEPRRAVAPAAPGPPDAVLLITGVVTVFDHVAHTVKVVTHARCGDDPDTAWEAAAARLDAEITRLAAPLAWPAPTGGPPGPPDSSFTRERFTSAVESARASIRAGDVLQLTLARRLSAAARGPAFEAFRALRRTASSPYGYFLRLGDLCLAGSASGTLWRRVEDVIETHVLTGSRARGRTAEEERRLEDELRAGERERAAHALCVDLARSDIGRVAEPGTVATHEWMEVERQSRAMHLASGVRGRPRQDAGPLDVLRAAFPAGSDCGLPRGRALELLEELEPEPRGVHTGAVGYFDRRGGLELCSSARTLLFAGGRAEWCAGAVIAADTDPDAAWRESADQARALALALEPATEAAP
jgi:anthranilate synthase component I